MLRRLLPLAAALTALSLAPPTLAAPKKRIALRLEYERPDPPLECPDAEQLGLIISAEFGYVAVRTDASAALSVSVRRVKNGFRAELRAPSPTGDGSEWRRLTDPQGTCQELAYDIAALVKLALGPMRWPGEEPPAMLAAPPELDVEHVELRPFRPRLPEALATVAPTETSSPAPTPDAPGPPTIGGAQVRVEVSVAANVMPYGLPGVAIGGGGMAQLRFPYFGLGMELRGATMPVAGFGEPELDARASVSLASFQPCVLAPYVDICGTINPTLITLDAPPPIKINVSDGLSMGFGGRLTGRYPISKRFTLLGFADASYQLRLIVIGGPAAANPTEVITYWRSPAVRLTLGLGVAFSVFE